MMNKKIKTSAVLCGLILAACQQPASPDPNPQPQPETRSFTLTISAEGVQPVSALRTLTVGSDNSASIVWKPEYQNRNISISVSGDGKSAPGANVSIAVVPDAPSTKISTDDDARLKAQLDVVVLQLAAMGITAAYSYSAMPSPVPSYANPNAQTRNITIALSRDGVPLPEISATLVEGESASGTFQWLPAYQKAATNFLMSVDGDTNPLPASAAAFTLNINGSPVGTKMSDADWSKLEAAVNAGLATIADMNVAIGKNLDETTVSRVADYPPPSTETVVEDVPALGTGGPAAKLSIPANGSQATLEIGTAGANYSDPTALGVLGFSSDLTGKSVAISFASQNPANVSLAYVHYVREAVRAAGGTAASVSAPTDKFTPVFDGRDWWAYTSSGEELNLYAGYSQTTPTQLIDGISVSYENNKYSIINNRALQVSSLVWHNAKVNGSDSPAAPFANFGLKKGTGDISLSANAYVSGGAVYEDQNPNSQYPIVDNFTAYRNALAEAGLLPAQNKLLDHSKVQIQAAGAEANVAANGMYDFILAYYNPKSDGT
ncbi:MAG: hypothetical protein LBQ88_02355, partial [Treponema sp.]|nr:hypothetical protein [Treponema sp.]